MIDSLTDFYRELDSLNRPLRRYCKTCKRHCCRGYIMLFREEAIRLLEQDVSVLRYSRYEQHGYQMDTYPRDENGEIMYGVFGPECPNRLNSGKCSVYDFRPLICRIYPMDLQRVDDELNVNWVIHKKCDFISEAPREEVDGWISKARALAGDVGPTLLDEIAIEWNKFWSDVAYEPGFKGYDLHILRNAFPHTLQQNTMTNERR